MEYCVFHTATYLCTLCELLETLEDGSGQVFVYGIDVWLWTRVDGSFDVVGAFGHGFYIPPQSPPGKV